MKATGCAKKFLARRIVGKTNIELKKLSLDHNPLIRGDDFRENDLATFEERLIFGIFRDFFK